MKMNSLGVSENGERLSSSEGSFKGAENYILTTPVGLMFSTENFVL